MADRERGSWCETQNPFKAACKHTVIICERPNYSCHPLEFRYVTQYHLLLIETLRLESCLGQKNSCSDIFITYDSIVYHIKSTNRFLVIFFFHFSVDLKKEEDRNHLNKVYNAR